MKIIIPILVLSVFLLTTVSGKVYDPYTPGFEFDPGLMIKSVCNCKVGSLPEPCMVGDCAGQRICEESLCLLKDGCGGMGCALAQSGCVMQCNNFYNICMAGCGVVFPPPPANCEETCDDNLDACKDNCQDDYDACAQCDGKWSSCEVLDPCCGVNCEANEVCALGSCVCGDTDERCAADGTGDGVDNDCDGDVDEGCLACAPPATRTCTDINNCTGIQNCEGLGNWTPCEKFNPCCGINCGTNKVCDPSDGSCKCIDSVERCLADGTGDGVDNDCDGTVDEGCSEEGSEGQGSEGNGSEGGGTGTEGGEGTGTEGEGTSGQDTGGAGTAPSSGPGQPIIPALPPSGSGIDMNLVMILVIIVVIGVIALAAIAMMKKKGGQAPPPQPPQPVVIQQ